MLGLAAWPAFPWDVRQAACLCALACPWRPRALALALAYVRCAGQAEPCQAARRATLPAESHAAGLTLAWR